MIDVAPGLLNKIKRDFTKEFNKSNKLKQIRNMLNSGTATYRHANEYAIEVGEILARVFQLHIKSSALPDGKMYFNIAERIVIPTLENNHSIVTKFSAEIQEQLNKSVGIGIKGMESSFNRHRAESIINRITHESKFDDVSWILAEPVVNFTHSVVDETIQANANFQGESGLYPTITRIVHGSNACDWCKSLAGTYKYPNIPEDVYRRHDRCRCTVEYSVDDVRKQNIWTKEWSGS